MSLIMWCRQINQPFVRVAALWLVTVAVGITAADIITTVVGGGNGDGYAASNNRISGPTRAITDNAGNIYFTEYSTQRVRKIAAGTGILSTIAGTGTAGPNKSSCCAPGGSSPASTTPAFT